MAVIAGRDSLLTKLSLLLAFVALLSNLIAPAGVDVPWGKWSEDESTYTFGLTQVKTCIAGSGCTTHDWQDASTFSSASDCRDSGIAVLTFAVVAIISSLGLFVELYRRLRWGTFRLHVLVLAGGTALVNAVELLAFGPGCLKKLNDELDGDVRGEDGFALTLLSLLLCALTAGLVYMTRPDFSVAAVGGLDDVEMGEDKETSDSELMASRN